jgi:hypothetical protein
MAPHPDFPSFLRVDVGRRQITDAQKSGRRAEITASRRLDGRHVRALRRMHRALTRARVGIASRRRDEKPAVLIYASGSASISGRV